MFQRGQGTLPSQTEINPKEQVMALNLKKDEQVLGQQQIKVETEEPILAVEQEETSV